MRACGGGYLDGGLMAVPEAVGTIDTHLAAMTYVVEESEPLGVDAELPRPVKAPADMRR